MFLDDRIVFLIPMYHVCQVARTKQNVLNNSEAFGAMLELFLHKIVELIGTPQISFVVTHIIHVGVTHKQASDYPQSSAITRAIVGTTC